MTLHADRLTCFEAKARKLLSEGFATKAAQGRAREAASTAFASAKELIEGLYHLDVPYEPNNWRPKHSALILRRWPKLTAEVAVIDRVIALYAEIKAAPVAPKAEKKVNDAGMLPLRSDAFNPELKAEFLKRVPEIKADYLREVSAVAASMATKFGNEVPVWIDPDKHGRAFRADHRFFGEHSDMFRMDANKNKYMLNAATVESKAQRYAELVALQWFYKTNAKLGQLDAAKLVRESHGEVVVTGTKGGQTVLMSQQRVLKRGPVSGELFNQFPSHLYIDGQFHTAAQYAAKFGTELVED